MDCGPTQTVRYRKIKIMPKKYNTHNKEKQTKIEQLVNLLFKGKDIPERSVERLREWIADPNNGEEKSEALFKIFNEEFNYSEKRDYAREMWPAIAERLGLDEQLLDRVDRKAEIVPLVAQPRKRTLRRRIAISAAAVLIPALVAVCAWAVMDYRAEQLVMVTVAAAVDDTKEVILPDGSKVTLFNGSQIVYERRLRTGRNVELTGHALFDVVKETTEDGERTPFTVSTKDIRVNVLGTVFRVDEWSESDASTVALYEGSVSVEKGETVKLLRGDIYRYDHTTQAANTSIIPAREMLNNDHLPVLRFENSDMDNLMLAMEINYGVKFVVSSGVDVRRSTITADFEDLPLDKAIHMLSLSDKLHKYERKGNKIIITPKIVNIDD